METYKITNNYGTGTFNIGKRRVNIVESEPVVGGEYKGEKITAVCFVGYAEDCRGEYESYLVYEIETVTQYGWDDPSEEIKSTCFVAVLEPLDIPEDEE